MKKLLAVLALVLIPAVAWAQIVVDHSTGTVSTTGVTTSTATIDTLVLSNGTPPAASIANGITLFASDDAGSSKFWLRDEAGNQEQVLRGTVDGTEIRLGSDAQGDIMFYDGNNYVRLAASATSGDRLESLGSGSNPAFVHNPAFSVHMNGTSQNIDPDTPTKIVWETKLFDTTGDFDVVTNNRWTPSVAGKYVLTGNWTPSTALDDGDPSSVRIYKNGVNLHEVSVKGSGTGPRGYFITVVVDANGSTDYFELFGAHSTTQGASVDALAERTWFMGMRIGP